MESTHGERIPTSTVRQNPRAVCSLQRALHRCRPSHSWLFASVLEVVGCLKHCRVSSVRLIRSGFLFFCTLASFFTAVLHAQNLEGLIGKGVKIPKFDRQNRLESLLSVEEAQQSKDFSHLKGLVWMGFVYTNTSRLTNLVVSSLQCSIHNASQSIYSDKGVKLQLGFDDISLEGTGFLFSQTNSSIFISNDVRSIIKVPARRPIANPRDLASDLFQSPLSRYWVTSKQFEFSSKTRAALYRHSVLLTDKVGLTLRTERLSAVLMTETNRLDAIYANTNLVVELFTNNQTNRIQGGHGVYRFDADPRNDLIEITQQPTWTLDAAAGKADRLVLHPRLNRFETFGNGFAKLNVPRETLEKTRLPDLATIDSDSQSAPPPVELRFGEASFEPGLLRLTNSVSAIQSNRLKLECLGLRGFIEPTKNELQRLEANGNVRVQLSERNQTVTARGQDLDCWFTGEYASRVKLRGAAEWATKLYTGKGGVLWIDMVQKTFQASNNASARIVFQTSTNLQPATSSKPTPAQRVGFGSKQVEVHSDRYGIRPGNADFDGRVQINNPEWRMECSRLHFQLNPESNQIEKVEASGNVVFEHFENKTSPLTATKASVTQGKPNYFSSIADSNAPWKLSCQELELKVSSPANQITMIQASQDVTLIQNTSRATGDLLIYDALAESLKLTGLPTVKTESKGEIRGAKNAVLMLDLKNDKLTNEGVVDILLPGGVFTAPEVKPRRIP